jgi:hypothetical protein
MTSNTALALVIELVFVQTLYSRFATGVECERLSTNETLRSARCQRCLSELIIALTLFLERRDDVLEFLSRRECVFTCLAAGLHSHLELPCPRPRAPGGPGRSLG